VSRDRTPDSPPQVANTVPLRTNLGLNEQAFNAGFAAQMIPIVPGGKKPGAPGDPMFGWSQRPPATLEEAKAWDVGGCGVGLRGGVGGFLGIDKDITDPAVMELVDALECDVFGPFLPQRGVKRSDGRPHIKKTAICVVIDDGTGKPVSLGSVDIGFVPPAGGDAQKVQIIGDGRQTVIRGKYAEGGKYVVDGQITMATLPRVPVSAIAEFWSRLPDVLEAAGCTEVRGKDPAGQSWNKGIPRLPGMETLPPDAIRKLVELIPNDDDYDRWIAVGMGVHGASEGSPDGYAVFEDWSRQSQKHDIGKSTEKTWDSFSGTTSSATTLRRLIEGIHGPDSPERQKAAQVFAADGGAFGVVEEDQIPMPERKGDTEAKAAGKKLDELLAEIAKTQPIPDHHRNGDSANWTNGGKVQTLREALKSGTVAPPVVVTPYERGILTVLAGMPGLGKSLLILNQALAITYNRPDLIRYGHGKLQFAGDIIYISNEDGKGLIKRRAQAWLDHHGLGSATPAHEIIPLKSALLNFDGKAWQVSCLEILEAVLEYVRSGRDIAMIVVDTMATSVTGINENAAQDISPVMAFLDRLAKTFWASVTFVHHVNKEAAAAGDRSIISIRGSTGITGAVRGALTLTPATAKEIEEFGWMGRQVIVEYVAKANDDKARYVACWYEQITVQIASHDAVDPTKMVMQETPILVPLVPTQSINDMAQVRAWRDLLEEAAAAGKQMRVYGSNVNNTGAKSVHRVLGVSVKKAAEIIEKMSNMGVITVEQVVDTDTGRKAPMVVIGGGFEVV